MIKSGGARGKAYRFRYFLDGRRWDNDWPAAYVRNDFGGNDSVVDLTALRSAARRTPAKKAAPAQTAKTAAPTTKRAGRTAKWRRPARDGALRGCRARASGARLSHGRHCSASVRSRGSRARSQAWRAAAASGARASGVTWLAAGSGQKGRGEPPGGEGVDRLEVQMLSGTEPADG